MSRVNTTSQCHVSSRGNLYFHGKHRHLTREILHGTTRVHTCKNEVIIERYRIYLVSQLQCILLKLGVYNYNILFFNTGHWHVSGFVCVCLSAPRLLKTIYVK